MKNIFVFCIFVVITTTAVADTSTPTDDIYNCSAGQYLVVGDDDTAPKCETCPAGYANSESGAISDGWCYTSCVAEDIIHATSVSGNRYKNGINTCNATGCENGWHVKDGIIAPDLKKLIGVTKAGDGYIANNAQGVSDPKVALASYGSLSSSSIISGDPMAFAIDYGDVGMIFGHGVCSTRAGTGPWLNGAYNKTESNFVDTLVDETGQNGARYCYCRLDNYIGVNGKTQPLFTYLMFEYDHKSVGFCSADCAYGCAKALQRNTTGGLSFRTTMFDLLRNIPAICEANTIELKWDGVANSGDVATCSYSGVLKTPATAPTKKGYTFTGWKVGK